MGGVIVRTENWVPRERWEDRFDMPALGLTRLVFEGEMGVKAALGQASSEDVWEWVGTELQLSREERSRLEEDFWSGDEVDDELVDFIRSLRPEYVTGMITNAWPEIRRMLEEQWRIADAFDVIVTSSEEQLLKPDSAIYHLALERLNVEPSAAIFIDDFQTNIDGAKAVGMQAILFRSHAQIRAELNRVLRDS
jgi:putative hydrolase of the HAD superfamily